MNTILRASLIAAWSAVLSGCGSARGARRNERQYKSELLRIDRGIKHMLRSAAFLGACLGWPMLINATNVAVKHNSKLTSRNGDPACVDLQRDLASLEKPKLPGVPDWKESEDDLTPVLGYHQEADFDFFNDGHIDRVFRFSYGAHVIQGSKILVQPGGSTSSVQVSFNNLLDDPDAHSYPCQLVDKAIPVKECSPLGSYHQNDTVSVYKRKGSLGAEFLVDFSETEVVRLDGVTYLLLSAVYSNDAGVVAVFRPHSNRSLGLVCVLHQGMDFVG